jgi:hypothetical protein
MPGTVRVIAFSQLAVKGLKKKKLYSSHQDLRLTIEKEIKINHVKLNNSQPHNQRINKQKMYVQKVVITQVRANRIKHLFLLIHMCYSHRDKMLILTIDLDWLL